MGLTSTATIVFFLLSLFLVLSSASEPVNPHPQQFPNFKIHEAQQFRRGCSYSVTIKTSCSSPKHTRDHISIAFGDLYRNEVYVPRLDDPSSGTFERCSTDTFKMHGPCGHAICYLYLRREGYDGWMPDSVKVFDNNYGKSVTFPFRTPLPNAVWYGFNNCHRTVAGAAANAAEIAGKDLVSES